LLHAALAVGTVVMPSPHTSVATAITLVEEKKKKDPPKPPPPPPPPPKTEDKPKPHPTAQPQAQQQQAKIAPEAKPDVLPPMPVDNNGFADLGVLLGNGEGPGIALPGAATAITSTAKAGPAPAVTRKVQQLEAPTQGAAACTDPVVRPKRKVPVAPKYTMQARQAEIEGVVRVQVTVDESGHVINARVVSGLGYGLDESALAAARATIFEPATQCGKPVVGTTILPFRFEQI
jgi:protein TonB